MTLEHCELFTSGVRELYSEQRLFDVTIHCKDEQISAHKVVLAAYCKFINTLLVGENENCRALRLDELNIEATAIRALVNFMYTGTLGVDQCQYAELLRAAEILDCDLAISHLNKLVQLSTEHVSESSDQVDLPEPMPPQEETAVKTVPVPENVLQSEEDPESLGTKLVTRIKEEVIII